MAPIHSRQLLAWTLPTIAALLSYFWYKKKRIGAQSDPGDKDTTTKVDEITSEIDKTDNVLGSSVTAPQQIHQREAEGTREGVQTTPIKSFSRSLSGVESTPIDIINPRCKSRVYISDEDLDLEIEKVKSMKNSNPIEEFQKVKKAKTSSPNNNNESGTNNNNVEVAQTSNNSSPATSSPVTQNNIEMPPFENTGTSSASSNDSIARNNDEVTQNSSVSSSTKATPVVAEVMIEAAAQAEREQAKSVDSNGPKPIKACAGSSAKSSPVAKGMKIEARPFECKKIVTTKINSVTPKPASKKKQNKNKNNLSQKDIAVVEEKLNTLNLQSSSESKGAKKKVLEKNGNKKAKNRCSEREELNRQSSERDSANHSPSDVMMASHSLSSISDNHSEGSNDSGKGCSDVATPPPSRIPGTDETVDRNMVTIYEFVIPQNLVGKLIGKRGAFVTQVNNKTNAQVVVKRHPTDDRLKACTIEGTQNEIDKALKMIRDRFPIKKFPEVTLESVTLTHPVPTVSLVPDSLYLKLVAGINNDTIMSCMVTPAFLFLQQPTHPTFPSLNILTGCMNMCYATTDSPLLPTPVSPHTICAAFSVDSWYRAIILSTNEEADTSYVKFLDYGGFAYVENSLLRQIRGDFLLLPFQAAECVLANVKPVGEDGWHEDAYAFVANITKGSLIYTQVIEYGEDDIPLVHCYIVSGPQQLVFLNQELVKQGFAEWVALEDSDTASGSTLLQESTPDA